MEITETEEDQKALHQDLNQTEKNGAVNGKLILMQRNVAYWNLGRVKKGTSGVYKLGNDYIGKRIKEKDIEMIVADTLAADHHINKTVRKTMNLLRNIRIAFVYLDEEMMRKLIVTMNHPNLEYVALVWWPSLEKHIRKLERIQRAVTKMIPALSDET